MKILMKKIVTVLLSVLICSSFLINSEIKAVTMNENEVIENQLNSIINKYEDKNIIFEDGIVLEVGEKVDINTILSKENESGNINIYVNNEGIINLEGNEAVAVGSGTVFIVVEDGDNVHIIETYVEEVVMANYMTRASINNRDHYVVYIDPGHGGSDPGSSGNGIVESSLNLRIALKVRDKLKSQGVEVIMSRENDVYVSLQERSMQANSVTPDVFVSVHNNSYTSSSANGIETWYTKSIDKSLADGVQSRLIKNTGATNRYVKQGKLYVTRKTTMPAILVEGGFLTNPTEAENLKKDSYQEAIANAIVDGTMNYLQNNITLNTAKELTATRIFGKTRYETSYEVFKKGWEYSEKAILVTGTDYADALTSAPLASKNDAPILLVRNSSLSSQSELKDLLVKKEVKEVYIVGGTNRIPASFESELAKLEIKSTRVAGSNRYETSVKVAEALGSKSKEVAMAYGLGFADGLSISSVAAIKQMPILLTRTDTIPEEVKNYINKSGVNKTYVIGSETVVSKDVENALINVERLGGLNRYETNAKIFNRFKDEINLWNMYMASASDFPDALSSSALAARSHSFVMLIDPKYSQQVSNDILIDNKSKINDIYVLGGNVVLSDNILYNLGIKTIK